MDICLSGLNMCQVKKTRNKPGDTIEQLFFSDVQKEGTLKKAIFKYRKMIPLYELVDIEEDESEG